MEDNWSDLGFWPNLSTTNFRSLSGNIHCVHLKKLEGNVKLVEDFREFIYEL